MRDVITGWDQGVIGMALGEERELTIPAVEGYGPKGYPAFGIPEGGTLIFTVQVLKIENLYGILDVYGHAMLELQPERSDAQYTDPQPWDQEKALAETPVAPAPLSQAKALAEKTLRLLEELEEQERAASDRLA